MWQHEPVLLKEALEWLKVEPEGVYVDATAGLGGHSSAILERLSEKGRLYCFEWNEDTYEYLKERFKNEKRVKLYNKSFVELGQVLKTEGVLADGILFDLGLSSYLIEGSGRGFTFQKNEPLDMRMSLNAELTAEFVLNRYTFKELAEVFKRGEVPKAEKFASFICKKRKHKPLSTTKDLVEAVKEFYHSTKKDLLAVVFQSIRIEVNKELENLETALKEAVECLKTGGRLVVISFHSLEDRIVKRFLKECEKIKPLTKKPIVPTKEEVRKNPRARSAKMRVGEKL
ncbi:MAG: 16S rRNA (cytosine(1402)-N(4))-methyltransferase RsmH [Thermodesulfobacteria bacterium]|nr:16S rRNA (cytosine(1402)-N(4))-methyltransferase RsmH [Thermodesulfobacteriota bacterium]